MADHGGWQHIEDMQKRNIELKTRKLRAERSHRRTKKTLSSPKEGKEGGHVLHNKVLK